MRLSAFFAPTLREDPAEQRCPRIASCSGPGSSAPSPPASTTLPLGLRSVRKIRGIVREEMEASGAIELRMPILLPADRWKATRRYELYGETLFRLTDRHERDMILGPLQKRSSPRSSPPSCPSYRDLPINLYQVEWKYRDEFRPRFGLLRGREFLMKDAYTFDRDEEGMRRSYDAMLRAYHRIFDRCALSYVVVEAEPGQIGGDVNHEFMARAEVGEDLFVECANGDYLADRKAATPMPPEPVDVGDPHPLQGAHAERGDDQCGDGAPRSPRRADVEDDAVRRRWPHRRSAGARRSRGRGGEARACAVPRAGASVRRGRFPRTRDVPLATSAHRDSTARQRSSPTTPFAAAPTG